MVNGQLNSAGGLVDLAAANRADNSQTWQWQANAAELNVFDLGLNQNFTIDSGGSVSIGTTSLNRPSEVYGNIVMSKQRATSLSPFTL